jgi:cytochrome d ubiquinol oxidase subunit I
VYALSLLRGHRDRYHRLGFLVPFTVAAIAMPLQIVVGDVTAREVFRHEPAKFAAIEALPRTRTHVPETVGGIVLDGKLQYGIRIPSGASLLAGYRASTRIGGLEAVPAPLRPASRLVDVVHLAFDAMVGSAFLLLGLASWFALVWWRRRELPASHWFLRFASVAGLVSAVSLEAGWIVTEVGRQPWTVVGLLLTRDAVTTTGDLWPFFAATVVIYLAVASAALLVLRAMHRAWQGGDGIMDVPYGPDQPLEASVPEIATR